MNENSCVGCKFLFWKDQGYSNYTVEETVVFCALKRNPKLPAYDPYDWVFGRNGWPKESKGAPDNWPVTQNSRCEKHATGETVYLDVEGEESVESQTTDAEVIDAINNYGDMYL